MLKQLLSRPKYEGVIDAVHYAKNGQVDWVRAYERRGPTWSDHVLINRNKLIERMIAGERFYSGRRVEFQATEFEVDSALKLVHTAKGNVIVIGDMQAKKDQLTGVPEL